jgi:RND superfamily putative drug exporter
MTLVPAVLALVGDRAWHLPRWIDRRVPDLDVEGEQLMEELERKSGPAPAVAPVEETPPPGPPAAEAPA